MAATCLGLLNITDKLGAASKSKERKCSSGPKLPMKHDVDLVEARVGQVSRHFLGTGERRVTGDSR